VDALRQALATVRAQLSRLSYTQVMLVLALAAVLVLVLVIVRQSTPSRSMVELMPTRPAGEQQEAASHLAMLGIKSEFRAGNLMVSADDAVQARAMLADAMMLSGEKQTLFETVVGAQNWTNTREQNDRQFVVALQNELGVTISKMKGIKNAKVFIDAPAPMGLGLSVRKPTASVTVLSKGGEGLSQATVDAIAALVAGSKAGLTMEHVAVIDGASGQQRRARREDQASASSYLEHAARVETQTREKVHDLLHYIPGVVVAVTAQVDVTRVTSQVQSNLPKNQGTLQLEKRTETTAMRQQSGGGGAAPGVEANQTADITRGGQDAGNATNNDTETTEFENHVGLKSETTIDPRGAPTMVAISVAVPRSFAAKVAKSQAAGPAASGAAAGGAAGDAKDAEPSDQQVGEAFDKVIRPSILSTLTPQVRALSAQAGRPLKDDELTALVAQTVGVSMMPMDPVLPEVQSAGLLGGLGLGSGGGGGGGGSLSLGGGLIDKVVLAGLATVAVGMMFMLVRKTGQKVEAPTAEELVGLPPALEGQAEVVGEAEEGETAMAGIEVGEEQMQSAKMLEQVNVMVDENAEQVARLLNRWIQVEE
jgi:flagellar biosynthesis/type III secretory pathway M-ring protein FliF/YscJ